LPRIRSVALILVVRTAAAAAVVVDAAVSLGIRRWKRGGRIVLFLLRGMDGGTWLLTP